ncbi:MAG: hypothetical protein OEZ36_02065, partial [Spirochaetota bacterium]|nr:hypothetical protein [Spirochaetota bacterium]
MRFSLLMAVAVAALSLSFLVAERGYAKEVLKFYDVVDSHTDYRGVRTFGREIRNTTKYMTNGWDYFIVYFKGRKVSRYQHLNNGNIMYEDRYVYKGDQVVKIKTYRSSALVATSFFGSDPLKVRTAYARDRSYAIMHFNSDKMLVKHERFDRKRRLMGYTILEYTRGGQTKRLSFYDGDKKLLGFKKHFYKRDLKVKTKDYNSRRRLKGYTTYMYDHNGKLMSARRFNYKGSLMGSSEYEYDDRGMLRYTLYYDRNGRVV